MRQPSLALSESFEASMTVTYRREDDIFFVELANPPVNAINLSVRDGLFAAVTAIQHEQDVRLVVVSGGPKIFAAGGDAREFDAPPVAPHLPDVLAMIEKSTVPWIAAITGAALGGGRKGGCTARPGAYKA